MHARSQAQTHSQMCMRFLFSGLTDANQSRWRGKEGGIEKARLRQAGGGRKVKKREILSSSEETKRGWWSTLTKRCRERERESCRFLSTNTEISCTWTAGWVVSSAIVEARTHTQTQMRANMGNRGKDNCTVSESLCVYVLCVFAHSQWRKSVFSECSAVRPKFNWILWKWCRLIGVMACSWCGWSEPL